MQQQMTFSSSARGTALTARPRASNGAPPGLQRAPCCLQINCEGSQPARPACRGCTGPPCRQGPGTAAGQERADERVSRPMARDALQAQHKRPTPPPSSASGTGANPLAPQGGGHAPRSLARPPCWMRGGHHQPLRCMCIDGQQECWVPLPLPQRLPPAATPQSHVPLAPLLPAAPPPRRP